MYPTIFDFGTIKLGTIHFPIAVHSFGLMMALAFLTIMFLLQRELTRRKLEPHLASSIVLWGAIGGIIGAKLYSVLQAGDLSILFSNSGLVWYGGLIGGTAAALYVIHRSSSPILPTLDALAPLLLLGYGIGRIGCFLAGDGDYGPPSDLPWAMAFPNGTVPTDVPVHPTPLYETGMSLIGFGLLWAIRKQKEGMPGWVFGGGLILTGIERFLAEIWRLNSPTFLGLLTTAQLFSILMIAIGGWFIYWVTHRSPVPVQAVSAPTSTATRKRKKRKR